MGDDQTGSEEQEGKRSGKETAPLDVTAWCRRAEELGAGEILLTSVDREGTRKGFDIDLVRSVSRAVPVPVIASGGMGTLAHFIEAAQEGEADAIAMADVLHYERMTIPEIRAAAREAGLGVRKL